LVGDSKLVFRSPFVELVRETDVQRTVVWWLVMCFSKGFLKGEEVGELVTLEEKSVCD